MMHVTFSSQGSSSLEGFLHFPINNNTLTAFNDANWVHKMLLFLLPITCAVFPLTKLVPSAVILFFLQGGPFVGNLMMIKFINFKWTAIYS